jgi:hypothetical protein
VAQVRRIFWGRWRGRVRYTLNSRAINHQSVVLVAASEGDEGDSTASPQRFVGAADIRVANVAPFDGGVVFVVEIDWDEPIPIWTDVFIADEFPPGFIRA